jgi:hypothetical protein
MGFLMPIEYANQAFCLCLDYVLDKYTLSVVKTEFVLEVMFGEFSDIFAKDKELIDENLVY